MTCFVDSLSYSSLSEVARVLRTFPDDFSGGRSRRTRANPGCINDATIHPPVPSPFLIRPYKHFFQYGKRPFKDERPMGLPFKRGPRFEEEPASILAVMTNLKMYCQEIHGRLK